jgi:hypothetical protein
VTIAYHQSWKLGAVIAATATGTSAQPTTTAAGAIPARRRHSNRNATAARPPSNPDCFISTAQPVNKPHATSQGMRSPRWYCTNAISDSTAGSDASSSPESVNDSMNGDAPSVARSMAAAIAGILPAVRYAKANTAATTSAPTAAAAIRIASAEPLSICRIARKTSSSPCGRSTQAWS